MFMFLGLGSVVSARSFGSLAPVFLRDGGDCIRSRRAHRQPVSGVRESALYRSPHIRGRHPFESTRLCILRLVISSLFSPLVVILLICALTADSVGCGAHFRLTFLYIHTD